MTLQQIEYFATRARLLNYGTNCQIDAENAVYDAVLNMLTDDEFLAFAEYCFKATLEERMAEALRLVRSKLS